MSKKSQPTQVRATVSSQQLVQYQGPLPPSSELVAYAAIYPDAPHIIFKMAEEHAEHKRVVELQTIELQRENQRQNELALNANIAIHKRNHVFAFIVTLVAMAFAAFLVVMGQQIAGISTFLAEVAALAYAFVKAQKKEPESDKK